jgi:hypothetical protein
MLLVQVVKLIIKLPIKLTHSSIVSLANVFGNIFLSCLLV